MYSERWRKARIAINNYFIIDHERTEIDLDYGNQIFYAIAMRLGKSPYKIINRKATSGNPYIDACKYLVLQTAFNDCKVSRNILQIDPNKEERQDEFTRRLEIGLKHPPEDKIAFNKVHQDTLADLFSQYAKTKKNTIAVAFIQDAFVNEEWRFAMQCSHAYLKT